jgi:signal transduction histidine kinase/DNA-binding response OmpR family regulator/Tfp pilus assembly protein PilF
MKKNNIKDINNSCYGLLVILFVFLFSISPWEIFAQNKLLDSLTSILGKEKNQRRKINLLHELHNQTYQNNPRQSLAYPQEVIIIASGIDEPMELSKAYQKIGMSYILLSEIDSAILMLTKAQTIAEVNKDLINVATSKRTLGTAYWYKNNISRAIDLYTESLQIFEQLNDDQQIATTISNLGTAYYVQGDFSKSIDYYSKALSMIDSIIFPNEVSSYLNDIGTIYKEWGNRSKALEFFFRSLAINERIGNKRQMAANIDNIGSIYLEDNELEKALEYYRRGLEIEISIDNIYGMASSYLSISSVHILKNQIDSSLIYLQNALKCYNHVDDKLGLLNTFSKFGEAYSLRGDNHKSIRYFNESIELAREIGDDKGLAYALGGLAQSYFKAKDYQKALVVLEESINLSKKGNFVNLLMSNYQCQSKIFKELGMPNKLVHALEKYIEVRDSVLINEKQKQASELLARFESEKKENEIILLNQQNELSQTKLARQRAVTTTVVMLLLVTGLVIFLLFRRYREKQRINTILSAKNREIEEKRQKIESQNEKLEFQAEQLRELDEVKSRFFANISHEFRTPLTLIIGPTEQLLLESAEPKIQSSLKLILRNAQNLLGLINQLLEISRIERGVVKMKFTKGNLSKELAFICEMFSSHAMGKGLSLEFVAEEKDITGYIDREKLEKIIFNLISNALKNTEKGKIEVSLSKSQIVNRIEISVSDSGKGIEKDKLPFIFDRFYMADDKAAKVGSGIGLAFTRELVKIYKGEIRVESNYGVGSTFTLDLPISTDPFNDDEFEIMEEENKHDMSTNLAIESQAFNTVEENNFRKPKDAKTILLVEDHEDLRKFVGKSLCEAYNVLEAINGREGIALAYKHLPDMIITDVMMPEVDGIELAKTLKNNENTSHIPIIMLTAKASEQSRIEGLETQIDDYLTKPFSIRELHVRIKNIIAIRERLREKYIRSIAVTPSEITTNSIDEQFIARILKVVEDNMNDTEFSVEMLCDKAGVSRTTLHNKLKSLLDQSATEFINSIRVKRAAQLIKKKAGNISEIAYDVGFNNLSYFTKVFKKYIGVTPSEMM